MFIVYSQHITSRLKYIFEFIFRDILLSEIEFTDNIDSFTASDKFKINYSDKIIECVLQFKPHGLLFHKGLEEPTINVFDWNDTKAFFKVKDDEFPFDPFSASFYLVSRYEEYLPHKRDHYDRYLPEYSLAFKNDFLDQPIIDVWALLIKERILQYHPAITFKEKQYHYQSTIDIDNAYAYTEKGFVRTFGGLFNSLLQGKQGDFSDRINTFLGKRKDPFDTFEQLFEISRKYDLDTLYFFLLADYGLNDKNVPHTSTKFRLLIKNVADYFPVGIHPSFASNEDEGALKKEINRLFEITHRDVKVSRQHFLKLRFPITYRRLIENEITDDFTMGYASALGFRASTCTSFYFYDLDREQTTHLKVHPFCVMDGTLRHYLNIEKDKVLESITPLIENVKKVKGTFSTLWHNESLSEKYPWDGWSNIYEEVVKNAIK